MCVRVRVSGYSEAEGALWESDASVGFHGNYGLMQWSGLLEIQYMLYASPSMRAHIPHTVYLTVCPGILVVLHLKWTDLSI